MPDAQNEIVLFDDPQSILEEFAELPDPRSTINRKHLLGELLVICILAVIGGSDGPLSIGTWAQQQRKWLLANLKLPNGIPSHDTIGRLLASLKPDAFQKCFQSWIARIRPQDEMSSEQIAIDGKVLRRSHDKSKSLGALCLVSAWSVDRGLSLGQLAAEAKSNEITAIPELLESIELKDAVITIDAAGTQTHIAKQIIQGGGDYVLSLKGNQSTIHDDTKAYIEKHMANDFEDIVVRTYRTKSKGHGRLDEHTYYQMEVPKELSSRNDWEGLNTIGIAVRHSEKNGKETSDVRYYISSLGLGVKKFAKYIRGHWAIENTLHWCLDVTFREDESRVRNRTTANNLAWLKRFTIGLLKQVDDKHSVAMRRRIAGWNIDYLAQVLGIKGT